ncbi:hypothetical protein [Microbacterium imperiale]|uniref:Helix-turn-helix domain-containing protein n=1 Tax=Microbacterium imperiale TaxID=33884 RepID=A0A9W6HEU7_9MICO|nr:hypothetical protein [Microbacterium imperiale]MBP2419672.1 hypothetical protein [Microbacterium imperiale]MDS0198462.1 hypothetical protein [Microbacterium imperiale]BFE40013.1 hypothetical protein GCM10017544_09690 [Microbacterium imperiale]GLJ79012.1 hypothetical protein GCM10017586_06940 [Microbacterium imperiale]
MELEPDDHRLYTYREAAARVQRAKRTIIRWQVDGMQMTWGIRDGQRVRLVREDVLLAYWRASMRTDRGKREDVVRDHGGRWRSLTSVG